MTDNEIIKAYECCSKAKTMHDCELLGCPAKTNHGCSYVLRSDYDKEDCVFFEMLKDFVDIYSRQKAEIERLHKVIETMTNEQLQFGFEAKRRLHKQNPKQSKSLQRLKEYFFCDLERECIFEEDIDNFVKNDELMI